MKQGFSYVVGTTIHGYTFSMFLMDIFACSNGKKMINSMTNGQFVPENDHYPWNNVKIAWYQAYTRNPPPNLQTMAWRYLLKIVIFWQKQTKMSQKQPKNDWFLLIFDVFTIKNSSKCFQNVFTETIDIKKTANISGFEHFRYYSNSIVPGGLEVIS